MGFDPNVAPAAPAPDAPPPPPAPDAPPPAPVGLDPNLPPPPDAPSPADQPRGERLRADSHAANRGRGREHGVFEFVLEHVEDSVHLVDPLRRCFRGVQQLVRNRAHPIAQPIDVAAHRLHHSAGVAHHRVGLRQHRLGVGGEPVRRVGQAPDARAHRGEEQDEGNHRCHRQQKHDQLQDAVGPLEQATLGDRPGNDRVRAGRRLQQVQYQRTREGHVG